MGEMPHARENAVPELPEVQTVVNTIAPLVVGKKITTIQLRRKDILTPATVDLAAELNGQRIGSVTRRGKRIVFWLATGNRFYIHLGMTGRLTVESPRSPLGPHTHLIVGLGAAQMRFRDPRRFGGIWWLGREKDDEKSMGPEPLSLRTPLLAKQLAKTKRAIKNALLDQSVVAGLGNIYVDESLFKAKIHPLTPADHLGADQVARLNRAIKFTLNKALKHRGSTLRDYFDANGNPGGFQKLHAVYDRAGLACRVCKKPIERIVMSGRSTHFCPRCQAATQKG